MRLGFGQRIEESIISHRCRCMQEMAIAKDTKVGCVIEGWRQQSPAKMGEDIEYFGGHNIELSTTYTYHAEMLALLDCIMWDYLPIRLYVTSVSEKEKTILCGDCRQQLLEVNKNCEIIVFNPDGSRKTKKPVKVSSLLPYHKNVNLKNKFYYERVLLKSLY